MIVDAVIQRRVDGRKSWKLDEIARGLQRCEEFRVINNSHADSQVARKLVTIPQ